MTGAAAAAAAAAFHFVALFFLYRDETLAVPATLISNLF